MSTQNCFNGGTAVAGDQAMNTDANATSRDGVSPAKNVGEPLQVSGGGRSLKFKKKNQITCTLSEMFFMHEDSMGNWADAAIVDNASPNKTSETKKLSEEQQRTRGNSDSEGGSRYSSSYVQHVSPEDQQPPPVLPDHATHSRNADLPPMPIKPPYEVRVANINFRTSDEDLYYHFGGEKGVVSIRSDVPPGGRRGIAYIVFRSQEALANGLKLDGAELLGRALRVTLRNNTPHVIRQPIIPASYNFYRNNGGYNQHEGGYSTLPHPRRNMRQQHAYYRSTGDFGGRDYGNNYDFVDSRIGGGFGGHYDGHSSGNREYSGTRDYGSSRIAPPYYQSNRGRDTRRHDYDNRLSRNPRFAQNPAYPRYVNRSFDSRGPPFHNENDGYYGSEHMDRRSEGRMRTDSIQSNATEGGTERHERPKLNLQPRTKPLLSAEEDLPSRPASIFGQAKPVDTYEKEKLAEERIRIEDEALKATAAARQQSKKSGEEHVIPASATRILTAGHVAVLKPPSKETAGDSERANEIAPKTNIPRRQSVHDIPLQNVTSTFQHSTDTIRTRKLSVESTHVRAPIASLSSNGPAHRRPSVPYVSKVATDNRTSSTLPRIRSSYNRTFTRSRDPLYSKNSAYQNSASERRGSSSSRRNNGNGVKNARRRPVGREPKDEVVVAELTDKDTSEVEDKKIEMVTAPVEMRKDYARQAEGDSQGKQNKKEKKKQAAAATKKVSRLAETKSSFSFSSQNKYAALLEEND